MFFDPSKWRKPTNTELVHYLDFLNEESSTRKRGSIFGFRSQLSPLFCYKYFYARFGPPNGPQTFFKKTNDSDNLIHWDYIVVASTEYLWIQSVGREIHVFTSRGRVGPKQWARWVKALKADAKNHGSHMRKVAEKLEKWSLISSRFSRVAAAAAEHHEILMETIGTPIFAPPNRSSGRGIDNYTKATTSLRDRANKVYNSVLALDLMTPILVEAYINLIIFILVKPGIRGNKRRMEALVRSPIDVRVLDLPLKCDHFSADVDDQAPEFKAFKRIMDRRNDIIHANISDATDVVETVYFDGFTPLFPEPADGLFDMWRRKEEMYDVAGVLERYIQIHDFMIYLEELLVPKIRYEVAAIVEQSEIGFDRRRKRLGRLFPNHVAMMLIPLRFDDDYPGIWGS